MRISVTGERNEFTTLVTVFVAPAEIESKPTLSEALKPTSP
jgi:hypothetical protein